MGTQLRLLKPEIALHDLEYEPGQNAADWVIVLPNAVLVVEAKATRLTEAARVGTERLTADFDRTPGRAIEQISRTSRLIQDHHPAFRDVPSDRPIVGLVVTLEPYLQSHSDLVWIRPESQVPIVTCASRELEGLVTVSDMGADDLLVDLVRDEELSRWGLGQAVAKHPRAGNPVLDEAWNSYPFREVDPATAQ